MAGPLTGEAEGYGQAPLPVTSMTRRTPACLDATQQVAEVMVALTADSPVGWPCRVSRAEPTAAGGDRWASLQRRCPR
jgi:hypothetical protein